MNQVLNPVLYRKLQQCFGTVRVSNRGQAMIASPTEEADGRKRLLFTQDGEYYQVCCFAKETLVATPSGDRPIADLVGRSTVLVPNAKGLGSWKQVDVRSFGIQPLVRLYLRRGRTTKMIRVTRNHRWLVSDKNGLYRQATTDQLQFGDRLASCHARTPSSYGNSATERSVAGKRDWVVVDREDLGEREEVFCAVVPGIERFTLADNLLTMNCPYCMDTRYRLYISHMFGKRDAYGRRMRFLALCFNEQCLQQERNRMDLSERLEEDTVLQEAPIIEGVTLPPEARVVSLPGPCVPLDRLKITHPACDYLASRGYDPVDMATRLGVMYCEYSAEYRFACNRIIFPVYEDEQLKGWQARYIGELPWKDKTKNKNLPPKYYSCPGSQFRSKCILNWDSMKHWETGVVVEGPLDVYRGGSMFGGIFGNVPSPEQKDKLYSRFRKGHLVFLTDPEEYDKPATRRFVDEFVTRMPGRSCAVKLPEGTDPGSLEREFIREYVRAEAAKQGITVKYRKVRK